jgi:hypothetical protein
MDQPQLVGEVVLSSSPTGTFRRVRRYYKGMCPELNGVYVRGYTGWETMVETDVIRASHVFEVRELENTSETD